LRFFFPVYGHKVSDPTTISFNYKQVVLVSKNVVSVINLAALINFYFVFYFCQCVVCVVCVCQANHVPATHLNCSNIIFLNKKFHQVYLVVER